MYSGNNQYVEYNSRRLLAVLAVGIILGCLACQTQPTPIRINSAFDESISIKSNDLKQALEQGVRFLIDTQRPDGSWGSFESASIGLMLGTLASHDAFRIATSALACMALMEVSTGNELERTTINKGIHYLMTERPETRATPGVLYHSWSLIYTTQCLARALGYQGLEIDRDELVRTARQWLDRLQHMQAANGGWCYYDFRCGMRKPSGLQANSFTTAAALDALWTAEKAGLEVSSRVTSAGLTFMERLRTANKTFVYGSSSRLYPLRMVNRVKGTLGRNQPCNLVLFRHGRQVTVSDLKLGLDRMFKEHHFMEMGRNRPHPHESWYATSGYYFFFGHFYAAGVIAELPPEEQAHYWRLLARVLLICQQADGSWWDYPLYGYGKAYGTAYALLALAPAAQALAP